LPAFKLVTIVFDVQINSPFPTGTSQVCNQGTLQYGGGNTIIPTDDPAVGGTEDPTCTPVTAPPPPEPCPSIAGNVLQNYCFEDGSDPWQFHTDGKGSYVTSSANCYQGQVAAEVNIIKAGSNVQL
jgi:hypothetical protein